MANSQPNNKLSSLLGDYDYNSDSELDDSLGTNGVQVKKSTNTLSQDAAGIIQTNWTQCVDKNTGHPYYWNIATKEVTWEIPDEYQTFLEQSTTKFANNSTQYKWVICSMDDQQPYYFNEMTREISWEKPIDYVEAIPETCHIPPVSAKASGKESRSHKNDRPKRSSKKYPFPELEDEKIELISSFNAKSDTSSEDDEKNDQKGVKAKRATNATTLNLVADYSDQSDEEGAPTIISTKTTKPLFAVTEMASATNILSSHKFTVGDLSKSESTAPATNPTSNQLKKPKSSFASIITGGRSPSQDVPNIELPCLQDDNTTDPVIEELTAIETELISKKLLKRKRRIEFNTSLPVTSVNRTNLSPRESESTSPTSGANDDVVEESEEKKSKKMPYANFLKGSSEFSEDGSKDAEISKPNEAIAQLKIDIFDLKTTLVEKLKFLCQDRPEVSPVQVIQIQMQTLLEAYDAEALCSDYIFKWLQMVSADLIKLEADAAPTGWKCFWDRDKAQYCYENLTTGRVQWEYPVLETDMKEALAGDEMDICTTPPPSSSDDTETAATSNFNENPSIPPAPPSWHAAKAALVQTHLKSGEPLPPGIEVVGYKELRSETINEEIASFYSDLATLDVPGTGETTEPLPQADGSGILPANIDGETSDEKKKKKKKKVKKLEPWRSGNLETWINKWQAAQKELDG